MIYEIEFSKSVLKALKKISTQDQVRILRSVQNLKHNPRKGSVRSMVGSTAWRLRVGEYRVIYDINDSTLSILVLKVGHRREVYKR